jgi:hypothetical protein
MQRDSHPVRSLTPEGSGKSQSKMGSVSARRISSVQDFRLQRDAHTDRSLTPEGSGKSQAKMGSVSAHSISPVQNFRLQKSTVEVLDTRPISSDVCGEDFEQLSYGENVHETQGSEDERARNAKTSEDLDVEARAKRGQFRESPATHERALGSDRSVYLPGDFRYLTSARTHIQDEMDCAGSSKSRTSNLSSNHHFDEQIPLSTDTGRHLNHSPYENAQFHHPSRYQDPSLRINSGTTLEMGIRPQGFVNRERRVADSTLPPSNTGNREDEGIRQTHEERYPGGSQDGGGTLPERFRAGRESLSVIRNITVRDSKRPKARIQDREYQRRSSFSPAGMPIPISRYDYDSPPGRVTGFQENFRQTSGLVEGIQVGDSDLYATNGPRGSLSERQNMNVFAADMRPLNIFAQNSQPGREITPLRTDVQPYDLERFEIVLTFEGHVHRHQVHRHMFVSQLAEESAAIFHLHEQDLTLMLFGMIPRTLSREKRISEPPPVGPGATVLIFNIQRHERIPGGRSPFPGGYPHRAEDRNTQQFLSSLWVKWSGALYLVGSRIEMGASHLPTDSSQELVHS